MKKIEVMQELPKKKKKKNYQNVKQNKKWTDAAEKNCPIDLGFNVSTDLRFDKNARSVKHNEMQ